MKSLQTTMSLGLYSISKALDWRVRRFSAVCHALAAVCLVAWVWTLTGCGAKSAADGGAGAAPPATPVQVTPAATEKISDTSEYLSILKSRHSATINPQVEGYITKIFVKSGDRVKTGTPLLQIDPIKQEATVSGQEAARLAQESTVNLAKINLERAKKLSEAGVISKSDLDNAQTTYDSNVAQLRNLEEQVKGQRAELGYYRVNAPLDGIVGDIPVRMGDRVAVTTLLTTVDEPGALEAYIYVPAARAADLHLGLPVRLLDEAGNTRTATQVTFVSPQVDTDTQTVLAKALVANPKANLRIAQQVRAEVTWGSRQGTVIPVLAVIRINGQFFTFVTANENGKTVARQRALKLGEIVGNNYAVTDGLKPGDHVIVSGTQFLQDGAPVTEQIQPAPAASGPRAASDAEKR